MTQATEDTLPQWELANIFLGLEADDYREAIAQLGSLLDEAQVLFDAEGIRRDANLPANDAQLAQSLEQALALANRWGRLSNTLGSFVYAYVSTDSYNALAARELSKLEILGTRWQNLHVRLQGWIGVLAERLPRLLVARPSLAGHAFYLRDTAHRSRFLMSEDLENLAADLVLDAGTAFGKLQGNVTSQLKVSMSRDGRTEELPITVVRNLCFDPDPAVREQAHRAELQGWESIRTTVAACLNGVKGTALTLARRRGRPSVLSAALDDNHIDAGTLDAMLGAIRDALPMFRRYLRAKAGKLGLERLRWWDLFAPLGGESRKFSWLEARGFIVERFASFSPDLGQFAARAFDDRWIDALPRDGKRGGAFCMEVLGVEESRILANFDGSFEQTSTLAHELGHGYHNHCQRGLEPLVRGAPMTLAETASIFCETLIAESALEGASPAEQLDILESQLCGATQVCLDITSRYRFETEVFARRGASELSADEFCELMRAAQAETYADAIEPGTYHPYMWLWKPHYYSHEQNFYNFPYAFGHLFSLGLFAIYRREGESFVPRYQELLRATGQDYAAPLAARFGIDITRGEFWRDSLQIIERQLQRFEGLPSADVR